MINFRKSEIPTFQGAYERIRKPVNPNDVLFNVNTGGMWAKALHKSSHGSATPKQTGPKELALEQITRVWMSLTT